MGDQGRQQVMQLQQGVAVFGIHRGGHHVISSQIGPGLGIHGAATTGLDQDPKTVIVEPFLGLPQQHGMVVIGHHGLPRHLGVIGIGGGRRSGIDGTTRWMDGQFLEQGSCGLIQSRHAFGVDGGIGQRLHPIPLGAHHLHGLLGLIPHPGHQMEGGSDIDRHGNTGIILQHLLHDLERSGHGKHAPDAIIAGVEVGFAAQQAHHLIVAQHTRRTEGGHLAKALPKDRIILDAKLVQGLATGQIGHRQTEHGAFAVQAFETALLIGNHG